MTLVLRKPSLTDELKNWLNILYQKTCFCLISVLSLKEVEEDEKIYVFYVYLDLWQRREL